MSRAWPSSDLPANCLALSYSCRESRPNDIGEVDLVLENQNIGPFWLRYPGDVFVECKNTTSSVEVGATHTFLSKVSLTRFTLAFFVSVNGFTGPAREALKVQAVQQDKPLVVPIDGPGIDALLEKRTEFELFFKGCIRAMTWLR